MVALMRQQKQRREITERADAFRYRRYRAQLLYIIDPLAAGPLRLNITRAASSVHIIYVFGARRGAIYYMYIDRQVIPQLSDVFTLSRMYKLLPDEDVNAHQMRWLTTRGYVYWAPSSSDVLIRGPSRTR